MGNVTKSTSAAKKTSGKTKAAERKRNFATIVYPDSAPAEWREVLSNYHIPALISPLHDKDKNPDGEIKKAHYHVLLMFESPKNFDSQVKPIFDAIGGVGLETVFSARGYARYLCHLDNPEKVQYNISDVLQLGGADYSAIVHLPTDDMRMLSEVFAYIRANQIYSLAELLDICAINNPDWFSMIAMNRCYVVDKYIKSLQWENDVEYQRKTCNEETGERL